MLPVVGAVYSKPLFESCFGSGIVHTYTTATHNTVDHAILIHGSTVRGGKTYYKVRNSWGEDCKDLEVLAGSGVLSIEDEVIYLNPEVNVSID